MNVLRLTVAALLIAGSAVYAQEPPPPPPEGAPAFEPGPGGPDRPMPPPGPEGREGRREFREPGMPPMDGPLPQEWMGKDVRELVETIMMARLSRELGLNDEQTVLTMRRFSEFREQSEIAKRERGDMMKALKEAIDAGQPDGDIEAKLVALVDQDRRIAASRQEIFEQVSEGLTMSQRARLYVIMGEFENDMRKLIQKARQRAGGQRGRFPGGPPPEGGPWGPPAFGPGAGPDGPMPPGPDGRRGFHEPGPPPQGEPGGQPGFRPDPDRPMPPGPMGREGRREFRGPDGRRPMGGPPPAGQEPGPPPPGNP
jgi:hypothetical protein